MKRSELRMYETAIKQRWPVPDNLKADIIDAASQLLKNPTVGERERLRAMQIVLAAEAQNQKDEHEQVKIDERARIAAIAERLGFDANALEIPERPATANVAGAVQNQQGRRRT